MQTLSCLIVEGSNQMHQGGKLSRFLKMRGGGDIFRSFSHNQWTWGVFSQNLQFDTLLQLGTKGYWRYFSYSKIKTTLVTTHKKVSAEKAKTLCGTFVSGKCHIWHNLWWTSIND